MMEVKRPSNDNEKILEKFENRVDLLKEEEKYENQHFYDSQSSSTSTSSMSEANDNLGIKSKLSLNLQHLEENQNQRKFSAPVTYSENFISKFIKIGKNSRGSYFNKLISKGLLASSEKEKKFKFNNIFIFDWDDTLLCTTVLSPLGYFDDDMVVLPSRMEKIKKLEISVKKLLTLTIEKGDTYIITNSEPGWVEYSCKRFFPNTFHLLDKIKIISARGLYEKKYPKKLKVWKNLAFNDIIKKYDKTLPTNIVCFGDSSYEIESAHGLSDKFQDGYVKAIKFKEFPKIEELISQLNLVLDKFNFIYSACKNWTITVDRKKKKVAK